MTSYDIPALCEISMSRELPRKKVDLFEFEFSVKCTSSKFVSLLVNTKYKIHRVNITPRP